MMPQRSPHCWNLEGITSKRTSTHHNMGPRRKPKDAYNMKNEYLFKEFLKLCEVAKNW